MRDGTGARLAGAIRHYFRRSQIVLELALLAALLSAAIIVLMAVGSAQVLVDEGSAALPLVYLLLAAVSVPLASGISAALCRWPVSRISGVASLASMLLALALRAALALEFPGASLATCIAAYALEIVFDTLFWLSASQHLPTMELKRQTPFLAAAFGLGGIFAGFAATIFCEIFAGRDLLLLDAAFFALCFAQYRRIGRLDPPSEEGEPDEAEPGILDALKATGNVIRAFPITGGIAASVLLMSALFCLQDYLAMTVYEQSFSDPDQLSSFMAIVYAGHQAAELLILAVCGKLILERAGPIVRNLIFPLSTCGGLLALLFSWSLPAAVFVHANVIALSNAVFEPVKTLDFAAIPYRVSAQVRVLVDGIVYPLGVALSALGLLWLQTWSGPQFVLFAAIGIAVAFVAVSALVGASFLPHLLRSLRLRTISPSEYARAENGRLFSSGDIRKLLMHSDAQVRSFGRDLAVRLAPELLTDAAVAFDDEGPPPPQAGGAWPAGAVVEEGASSDQLVATLNSPRLRRSDYAMVGERAPKLPGASGGSRLRNQRRSDAGIWRLALIDSRRSADRIHDIARGLEDRSQSVRRASARLLATFGAAALPTAAAHLRSERSEVAEAAIFAIGGIGTRKASQLLHDHLQPLFARARLNLDALDALRQMTVISDDDAHRALMAWLSDSNRRIVRRVFVVKSALGNPRDVKFLHAMTQAREPRTRSNACEALINMPTKRFIQPVMPLLENVAWDAAAPDIGRPGRSGELLVIEKATAHDPWARLLTARLAGDRDCSRLATEEEMMLDLVLFLKTTPLFSAVAMEDIARFARLAEPLPRAADEAIVEAHEPIRHVYVIRSGTVDIGFAGRTVETLGPRQSFGESALFGEDRPAVSFRAASAALLLRFSVSIVSDLVAENPDVLGSLLLDIHLRLSALHGRMATIEAETAQRSRGLGIDVFPSSGQHLALSPRSAAKGQC